MGETSIIAREGTFLKEDGAGLLVACVLHVAVMVLLLLQPLTREIAPQSERMTVSLASEVSLEATAPRLVPESRAAIAPTLDDDVTAASREAPDDTSPTQTSLSEPPPPVASAQNATRPISPAPDRPRTRPDRPTPPKSSSARKQDASGSLLGDEFLKGTGSQTDTDETGAPAATFGAKERAALTSAITRQLRPNWSAPIGVDADKLVSIVSWKLNRDGSLKGRPTCKTVPASITASNRPQAGLHCERAIRAVRRAAPFNLPEQFYSRWDDLEWDFDRRL